MLGPVLFLIFISDIDSNLLSSILKFADDIKLFGKANKEEDSRILQADLNHLMDWSGKWQIPFNVSQCKVMHLGHRNNHSEYYLGNHRLESVNEEKDLGIYIIDNLKPTKQCQQAYYKASRG